MPRKKKNENPKDWAADISDLPFPKAVTRKKIKEETPSANLQNMVSGSDTSMKNEDSSNAASVKKVKVKNEPVSKLCALKEALAINEKMREVLKAEMNKFKVAQAKNQEKQDILKGVINEDKCIKMNARPPSNIRAISVFAAPYFRDIKRMVPPLNEDARIKRKNNDVNAYLTPPRPWHRSENKKLLDGVTGYALMAALKPVKIRRDYIKSKLKNQNLTDEDIEYLQDQLVETEQEIKKVSSEPLHGLLDKLQGNIDWMTISSVNMEGGRSPEECEALWNNFLDFTINKEAFTEIEDEQLRTIALKNNERDWDYIAESLQTDRTAIQCFERYQTRLSSIVMRRYWTKEEDEKLAELVEKMKVGKIVPWNKIALQMEGRTRQQIINRYERSISKAYNRGPWTPEEDAILVGCVQKFGLSWSKIRPFFKRRSPYALRERYVNILDPSIKMGSWSKDEDRLLINLVRRYGYGKWSKICKHISGRTDNMCLVRAGRLLEHSVKFHSDNGVEYDIDVNDPELFAKIMKPIAPTKICVTRNDRLKSWRDAAVDNFMIALQKVMPSFNTEESNLDSLDFTCLNVEILHRISEELHNMMEQRECMEENRPPETKVNQVKYIKRHPRPNKRLCPEIESTESESDCVPEVSEEFSEEKKLWIADAFEKMFQLRTKIMHPMYGKRKDVRNARETAECSLYKAYLYKQFCCKALCDEDDDITNVTFSGVDYSETLQTVVSYFIQPPLYDKQFIVLSPNMTTLRGMEVIEATLERMQSMSELVRYSKPYLDYVCERSSTSPRCLQCLHRKNVDIETKISPQIMISDMKGKHFVVEENMEKAALVESAYISESSESCCCDAIEKSRQSVRLLIQRFMGLFLWPALLSVTRFSKEQENIICAPQTKESKNYFWRMQDRQEGPGNRYKTRQKRKKDPVAKNTSEGQSGVSENKFEEQNDPDKIVSEEQSAACEDITEPCSSTSSISRAKKPVIAKKRRRKINSSPPATVRRSMRSCVVNRVSFSYPKKSKKSDLIEKEGAS